MVKNNRPRQWDPFISMVSQHVNIKALDEPSHWVKGHLA